LNFTTSHARGGDSSQYQLLTTSNHQTQKTGRPTLSSDLKVVSEATSDAIKLGNEQLQGLISREIRDQLFMNICKH
jgi:hypothetical protein